MTEIQHHQQQAIKHVQYQASSSTQEEFQFDVPQRYKTYFEELQQFKPKKLINQRHNSSVWLIVEKKTGNNFAMKVLKKSELSKSQLFHINLQVTALKQLKSQHFVQAKQIRQTEELIFIIMEYYKKGDLANYFDKEPYFNTQTMLNKIQSSKKLISQIFIALNEIHKQGFVFQDLKPQNILFDNQGRVKICDFGLVCEINSIDQSLCGTLDYMPPQRLSPSRKSKPLATASDMWSLGVLIYEIVCGQLPYHSQDPKQLLQEVYQRVHFPNKFPIDAKNLVLKLLNPNPLKRLTSEEFKNHKFFNNLNWNQVYKRQAKPSGYIQKIDSKRMKGQKNRNQKQAKMLDLFN